ncbi:MAG: hypothetical protein AAFQ07_10020 [Chloroflexota bacterium]
MFMSNFSLSTPLEDPALCCNGTLSCGSRVDIDGTDNYAIWNGGFSFNAYLCFADGTPADAFHDGEDTTLYTEDGQVVVHDWWGKQLLYYDGETLTLVDTINCEDNACTGLRGE